jgi:protein-disulfide isomerase
MKLLSILTLLTTCLLTPLTFAETHRDTTPEAVHNALLATPVTPHTFDAAQKTAIENIVHDYLLAHPEVLMEVGRALELKQQASVQAKAEKVIPAVSKELLNDSTSPVAGNPKGAVSIVEFFDYQCPHCKVMAKEIDGLLASDHNVRIVYKELPIFGADSEFAAKAALAAQRQGKFLVFHNALLNAPGRLNNQIVLDIAKSVGLDLNTLQAQMNMPEYSTELKNVALLAQKLGINGTPGFVVLSVKKDGKTKSVFIPGQTTKEQLLQAVHTVQ